MKEEVCKEGEKRKVDWLLQRLRALEVRGSSFCHQLSGGSCKVGWKAGQASQRGSDKTRGGYGSREGDDRVLQIERG